MPRLLTESPARANLALLTQAAALLEEMPEDLYRFIQPPVFLSSIGAHLRHVLDHYDSLIDGFKSGQIDYHSRKRDVATENHPSKALSRIFLTSTILTDLADQKIATVSALNLRVSAENSEETILTTAERELYFSLSHTVHHYAIIGMIARNQGHEVPEDFGVAPSTLAFRRTLAESAPPLDFEKK